MSVIPKSKLQKPYGAMPLLIDLMKLMGRYLPMNSLTSQMECVWQLLPTPLSFTQMVELANVILHNM